MRSVRVLSMICMISLAATTSFSLPKQASLDQEDAISETVIRQQFSHCSELYKKYPFRIYFLARGMKDFGEGLMDKFKETDLPVKKISAMNEWFKDKESGAQGIIIEIQSVNFINEREAVVETGCIAGGTDGYGQRYKLQKAGEKWVISEVKDTWIS